MKRNINGISTFTMASKSPSDNLETPKTPEKSPSTTSSPPTRPPQPKVTIGSPIGSPRSSGHQTTPPSVKKHYEHLKPLTVERVRWFYYEEKRWIAFNGSDTLEIENTFRSLPEELKSLHIPEDVDRSEIELPTVRGSLYEVDILDRECRPIYWNETAVPIRRGTWFKGGVSGAWEPFEEKDALKIEEGHVQVIRSMGFGSSHSMSPGSQSAIHSIKIGVHRVDWHDISDVYIISESTGSRLAQKIGLSGATPLHRGYEEDALLTDRVGEITHIIFLVHGMGQLYHGDGGIINSRKKFAEAIFKGQKKFFEHIDFDKSRIEFFPIEWRSKLKLDEGIIDSITPENLGSLRRVINDTTLDVFYYTSPCYREEIIQALRHKLNFVYRQFCDRNPSFEENGGKVSIIAHSLGSVIIHDVLTLWNSYLIGINKKLADVHVAGGSEQRSYSWFWGWGKRNDCPSNISLSGKNEEELKKKLHQARLDVAKIEAKLTGNEHMLQEHEAYSLEFKVEYVFNIGSPLGVFLVMRGIRPRDDVEQHILPTSVCKRTFNVYDPADPVAYRLEPVIYDYYSAIPPVRLAHVGSTLEPRESMDKGNQGGWFKALFGNKAAVVAAAEKQQSVEFHGGSDAEVDVHANTVKERTKKILEGKKVLKNRIDYVLEQSMIEYFSAITSHQAYWHNLDFAKFVLQAIFSSDHETGTSTSAEPTDCQGDRNEEDVLAELERRTKLSGSLAEALR